MNPSGVGQAAVRTYIPRPNRGRRKWEGKAEEQQAVYRNRRRVQGHHGKHLLKKRGELIERSFAHCYETGGMRRTHLRGRENILKRQLIHVYAFNSAPDFPADSGCGNASGATKPAGGPYFRVYVVANGFNGTGTGPRKPSVHSTTVEPLQHRRLPPAIRASSRPKFRGLRHGLLGYRRG